MSADPEADRVLAEYEAEDEKAVDKKRDSQATALMHLVEESGAELWHTPDGSGFITVKINEHHEHYAIVSKQTRDYLSRTFYSEAKKAPSASALQDAIGTLSGVARFDGAEREVAVRVAGHGGAIYLDLADDDWTAVRVTPSGWKLVTDPPVRFRRPRGLRPLPDPVPGGSVDELRELVNIETDDDWYLLVGWLVGALRAQGPYPVLSLSGEQGSAKSTTARLLRGVVDPHEADLRAEPREIRDLMIAATSGRVVALDNVSRIQDWLSDALCRLSTGGALGSRTLYTNDEETILSAQRPVMMTGIAEVASRGDLLDRTLSVSLPSIPEEKRTTEATLQERYEEIRPRVLGALLDAVAYALGHERETRLDRLPRLADWAKWVTAAEPSLGWKPGSLIRAHRDARQDAVESMLEGDRLAAVVRSLELPVSGRSIDLLKELTSKAGFELTKAPKDWPANPRALSSDLARLAPSLRRVGINVARQGHGRMRRLITLEKVGAQPSPPSPPSPTESDQDLARDGRRDGRDGPGARPSPNGPRPAPPEAQHLQGHTGNGDGRDGRDGRKHHFSTMAEAVGDPDPAVCPTCPTCLSDSCPGDCCRIGGRIYRVGDWLPDGRPVLEAKDGIGVVGKRPEVRP